MKVSLLLVSSLFSVTTASTFRSHVATSAVSRQTRRSTSTTTTTTTASLAFLQDDADIRTVQSCSSLGKNLLRGAALRIASDLTGGTPLETIKTRVTVTKENIVESTRHLVKQGGLQALWKGTPSRTLEGAVIGALFLGGSVLTKQQLIQAKVPPTVAALAGGVVGGVCQSLAMTPAGLIFTAVNTNDVGAWQAARIIVERDGIAGLYAGSGPMVIRQASNWASRAGLTELARSSLRLSQFGVWGEVGAGVLGGVGSCWNTPIETIRVVMQRDIAANKPAKSMGEYWNELSEKEGVGGLFRGVTPRALQSVWQTVFLVVVPNMMGI